MSRLTVKDRHTGRTVEVSERSWNIGLKTTKMPNGSGELRYQLLKTEPRLKEKKSKIDLSENDNSNGGGERGEN